MRILHIGKYYRPYSGGIENFMLALMEESILKGHIVTAVVHDHTRGTLPKVEVDSGVQIYRVKSYGQLLYAPIAPSFFTVTQRIIRDFKPDVLHLHMPNLSVLFLLVMKTARKLPWVIHWHSDVEFTQEQPLAKFAYKAFYATFESAILRIARKIIVTSSPYLNSSKALMPYVDKCAVVPLGLSKKRNCYPLPKAIEKGKCDRQGILKLLVVGRLSHYKGNQILLEALAKIPSVEEKIRLDIVGTGECELLLVAQMKRLKLEVCVNFRGYEPDSKVNQLFRDCDVFCLTSTHRSEAFGLVLLEAFKEGKPCIVSNVEGSGMTWVVNNELEGWHFENGDAKSLASALIFAIANPNCVSEFGQNALKRYNNIFTIDKIFREIENLYRLAITNTNTR